MGHIAATLGMAGANAQKREEATISPGTWISTSRRGALAMHPRHSALLQIRRKRSEGGRLAWKDPNR